ncbi:MAG: lysostaphin resistance A-like protein [Phycicoccus sp.]
MRSLARRRPVLTFVLLAYAISWTTWGLGLTRPDPPDSLSATEYLPFLVVGSFGPSVAAVLAVALAGGRAAVAELLRSVVRARVGWRPYLVVFFALPLVAVGWMAALGFELTDGTEIGPLLVTVVLAAPINAVLGLLGGVGPLGEELGWRGFALPRLVDRHGPWSASAVLGLVWAFWHAPLAVFADWRVADSLPLFAIGYPSGLVALALIITVVWQRSRRSVFVAILLHQVANQTAAAASDRDGFWALDGWSDDRVFIIVNGFFVLGAMLFIAGDRLVARRHGPPRPRAGTT